ncbi:MAG: S9 family peptidase [Gammaproteobacteria bacterium]|nr:S9 family peptidase [Gammaproteobacteria bacterium]
MRRSIMLAALAGPLLAAAALAAPPAPPSIETLAAYPAIASFSVSPDGRHLAALEARGEDRVVLVWDTDDLSRAPTVIGTRQMKFRGVQFIKNDTLAVSLWQPIDLHLNTVTRTFAYKLYFTDLQGRNWREPLQHSGARSETAETEQAMSEPVILDSLPNDPDHVLVINDIGVNQGDIYKVHVRSGRAQRIQRADEHTAGYLTDLEGTVRARTRLDVDPARGSYTATELRNPDSGAWEEHFRTYAKTRDVTRVAGFSRDPDIAYVLSNVGRDKIALYQYDVRARRLGELMFEHRFFDVTGLSSQRVRGERFGEIIAFRYGGPASDDAYYVSDWGRTLDRQMVANFGIQEQPVQLVDPATGATAQAPLRTGRDWRLISGSLDNRLLVISLTAANEPASFYLLRDQKVLTRLGSSYPNIEPAALGSSKLVYYRARDGLAIPAFLHTPNRELCGAGPWPAVVHPHGGPWARDDLGFDYSMWIPLLVSRCRAVLQPQYRGSDGWGAHLWLAGDREWGQKMQDDKDDGAQWLIEQKIAIPDRIAMFGFSYGGYASMVAAVRPRGLYKCAIAGAGVSDIERIWAKFYTNAYFRDHQAPTVKGLSPLSKADQIQIPIYVYHGDRDQIVPIEQSEWFVAKARAAKQDVTYREFRDYAHGPAWTRATMAEQLRGIDDYLARGCGGGGL